VKLGHAIILPHTFWRITRADSVVELCNVPSLPELPQLPKRTPSPRVPIQLLRAERDNIFNYMPHRQQKTATGIGIQISSTTTGWKIIYAFYTHPEKNFWLCVPVFFFGVFIKEIHTAFRDGKRGRRVGFLRFLARKGAWLSYRMQPRARASVCPSPNGNGNTGAKCTKKKYILIILDMYQAFFVGVKG